MPNQIKIKQAMILLDYNISVPCKINLFYSTDPTKKFEEKSRHVLEILPQNNAMLFILKPVFNNREIEIGRIRLYFPFSEKSICLKKIRIVNYQLFSLL